MKELARTGPAMLVRVTDRSGVLSDSPHSAQLAPLLASAAELLKSGCPAEAIAPLREAARLVPSDPALQHDLGLACLEAGHLDDAIAAFERAISSDPDYSDAWFRLGIAREKLGDARAAVAAYHRATELAPSLTEAWFRAGALVYTLGHRAAAVACFRRAAVTGGKTSFGRLGKARALLAEERYEEAELILRKTLAVDPSNALAHDLLGNLLSEFGRFDQARCCFERTVELAPLLAGTYYELVRCRPLTSADRSLLERMIAALDTPGLESSERLRLHLAIGKAFDDLGDCALAMQHFDDADALRRQSCSFDPATFSTEIDRLISRTTPEWIARARQLGSRNRKPVFIVGMPRSGTTLIEQIVSMHPDVRAGGELNFWNERGAEWHRAGSAADLPAFFAQAATDYSRVLHLIGPKAARVTDKMPFNFLWAGLIHATFPDSIILHCRRTAIDTALSIHQTHFHPRLAFPTGGEDLVAYFRVYQRLMAHWRSVLPRDRFVEVDYQELTSAPAIVIPRIIAACGLPWHEDCLRPETNSRAVNTPSKWQTRQPIYRSSVERWRRYEPWLGPLRALLKQQPTDFSESS